MCGILAISDRDDVSRHIFRGLANLRHRGPNAWGIAIHDAERGFRLHRSGVWPANGCSTSGLPFHGRAGIGHTRYATTLSKDELTLDAQPLASSRPGLVLAFNGHIQDLALRSELEEKGWLFQTKNDGEVVLNMLCEEIQQRIDSFGSPSAQQRFDEAIAPSVARLMERLAGKGSYSVVAMLADGGIIAFRDPHGFRPLFFASDPLEGPGWVFASETAAIGAVGRYKILRPVEAGELVYLTPSGDVQAKCLQRRAGAFCALEAVYLADIDSRFGGLDTYQLRQRLGEALANQFPGLRDRIDLVVGVPESAVPAALKIAELWKRPFGGLLSRSSTRTFLEPDQNIRESAAESKYRLVQSAIQGKCIALVDDSIVRGTTMRALIGRLRAAGAKEVHVMVTFPPIQYPCFYGIDIPDEKHLIAARAEGRVEVINNMLVADSLNYLDDKMLRQVLANIGPVCLACADGWYPDRSIASPLAVASADGPQYRRESSGANLITISALAATNLH